MDMSLVMGLVVLLAGCGSTSPEVTGGTEEVRGTVQDAVDLFYEAVLVDVQIREIKVKEWNRDNHGEYNYVTRRIRISPEADDPGKTVTHELCHALDHQHDITKYSEEPWLGIEGSPLESFAWTCEVGPEALALLGETCEDDPEDAAVFQRFDEWFATPSSILPAPTFEPMGTLQGVLDDDGLQVFVTQEDTLELVLDEQVLYLDPWTGEELGFSWEREPAGSLGLHGVNVLRWDGDGERVIAVIHMPSASGDGARRVVLAGPEGLARAGCVHPGEQVAVVGGEWWSVWPDGEDVVWGRWVL